MKMSLKSFTVYVACIVVIRVKTSLWSVKHLSRMIQTFQNFNLLFSKLDLFKRCDLFIFDTTQNNTNCFIYIYF